MHLTGLSVNAAGTRVYIIGEFGRELLLYVLDVLDPTNPVELARFVWPLPFAGSFSPGRPVANENDSLLIFADGSWERERQSRLHILDISDLSSIHEVSSVGFPSDPTTRTSYWAHDLAIRGNLVYSTWLRGGVQAIDITDPANPLVVGGFLSPVKEKLGHSLSDVAMYGDYAVAVAVYGPGLYILGSPTVQSTETAPGGQEPVPAPAQPSAELSTGLNSIVGHWEGVMRLPRREMEIVVDFWTDEDGSHGSMTLPGREGITLVDVRFEPPIVHFEGDGEFGTVYEGELEGDTISGTAQQSGGAAPFSLKRTSEGR